MPAKLHRPTLRKIISALAISLFCFACSSQDNGTELRVVKAMEIPLESPTDRNDLLAMLRRHAANERLRVDDVTESWVRMPLDVRKSIYVGVWNDQGKEVMEVGVDDGGHLGKAWVSFFEGAEPAGTARRRELLLTEIGRRWPNAREIPVLPSGGLPLARDLRLTPTGYKIIRSAAAGYEIPPSSPVLTSN